jgi:hypothetical protein
MKKLSINDNEEAFISTLLNIIFLVLIIGIVYVAYTFLSDPDLLSDFGSNAGEGIFGAISGAIGGFFGGAWNLGKDIGEETSFVPEFIKSLKFW